MARPALALLVGAAEPSTVTLGMSVAIVRAAERQCDDAAAELVQCAEDGPERDVARARFDAACDRLDAALNRRDRVISELGNQGWLWLVPREASGG